MKEFVDKLISRLEKELKLADEIKEKCARENPLMFGNAKGYATGIANAKYIVNQLAEEYNTDIPEMDVNELLEEMEQNDGWIPCSERLPEESTVYEVTEEIFINSKKQYIVEHRLFGTEGEWLLPSNRKVIAWQPLPAPYQSKGGV